MKDKALLIPMNSKSEILIQDRRGYKAPDWGFFGGSIEEGETPLQGVMREAKEELDLDLKPEDLIYAGEFQRLDDEERTSLRHFFLYKTDREHFEDFEANGAHWVTEEKARELIHYIDTFDIVMDRIKNLDHGK